MAKTGLTKPGGILAGVLILGSIATVFLIQNFGSVGFGSTWPVVVTALGLSLVFMGYLELGLGVAGVFLIWLLANLAVIPSVGRSWPFFLIWIVLMVLLGFFRARATGAKTASP